MQYKIGDVLFIQLPIEGGTTFRHILLGQHSGSSEYYNGYTLSTYSYEGDEDTITLGEYIKNIEPILGKAKPEYVAMYEEIKNINLPKSLLLYTYVIVRSDQVISKASLKYLKSLTLPFDYV